MTNSNTVTKHTDDMRIVRAKMGTYIIPRLHDRLKFYISFFNGRPLVVFASLLF